MTLQDLDITRDTIHTLFKGLKVRTTSGFEGYLQVITKHTALLTEHKCSPESECPIHRVYDEELEDIANWTVLEQNSEPVTQHEQQA